MGMTVVGTLVDANPDFFRFLDRMEQAQSPSDNSDERDSRPFYLEMFEAYRGRTLGEIEATKALFHKDKEDDYYEVLQEVGPEYKGTGLDPPLARLEKGPKLLDKIKSFLERETPEKVKGAEATPSELQDCSDLIEEVDEFRSTFSKDIKSVIDDFSWTVDDEFVIRSDFWNGKHIQNEIYSATGPLRTWQAYFREGDDIKERQAEKARAKASQTTETEIAARTFRVLALDTKTEWNFYLESIKTEDPVKPTPGILLRGDYLRYPISPVTQVLGRDKFRPTNLHAGFYEDGVLDGTNYWAHTYKAKSKVLDSLSDYLKSGYATFMLTKPEWRERLGHGKTLEDAGRWINERVGAPARYNAFMADAMAWRKRELVRDALYKDKHSPLYHAPTGTVRDGGDFGARSLATADGFLGTVMGTCLDSGNTMTGYIHTFAAHKFAYTLTPSTWSSTGLSSFMDTCAKDAEQIQLWERANAPPIWVIPFYDSIVPKQDVEYDRTSTVSWSFVKASYARYSEGEPIQKTGHCKLEIVFKGRTDKNIKDFDQYDKYEGKELQPVSYRAKAAGAIA